MADARKILKATIVETPWNTALWIVHVSFAEVRRSTFALVIVGIWLRRGCLRLSGIQIGMLVYGRVVVHLIWRLAKSVRPYVAGVNVGSVITCACGISSRCFEVGHVPDAMDSSSRKVESGVSMMRPIVIMVPKWSGEVCIPCFCISSSWAAMMLVMSSEVDSGM